MSDDGMGERFARLELRMERLELTADVVPRLEGRLSVLESEVAGVRAEVQAIRPVIARVLRLVEWGGGIGVVILAALQALSMAGVGAGR